jgi:hypothetical protein
MTKENGRKARPTTSAKLKMAGTIHLALTPADLRRVLAGEETALDIEGMELILQIEQGKENKLLEITPWFDLDHSSLSIDNSIRKDGIEPFRSTVPGYMEVDLVESEKRSLGFTVNPGQARALARVLLNYAEAWDAIDKLWSEPAQA